MKMKLDAVFLPQLDTLLEEYDALCKQAGCGDLSDLPIHDTAHFVTRARAAIHRMAGQQQLSTGTRQP